MAKGDHVTNDQFITIAMLKRFDMLLVEDQASHDVFDSTASVLHGVSTVFRGTLHEFRCGELIVYINDEMAEALRVEGAKIRINQLWQEYEDTPIGASYVIGMGDILSDIIDIASDFQISMEDTR